MRSIKKLKINESIQRKRLVFEEDWTERFEPILLYLLAFALIVESIMIIKDINPDSQNDMFFICFFCPLAIWTGIWVIYRKLVEKKLITVKSKFNTRAPKITELIVKAP